MLTCQICVNLPKMTSAGQACSVWVENLAAILENELARGLGRAEYALGRGGNNRLFFQNGGHGSNVNRRKKKLVLELYVVGQLLDRIWLSNNNQHSRPSEVFGPV